MKIVGLKIACLSTIFAANVHAGLYNPEALTIELPGGDWQLGKVSGSMGHVRFSANDVEQIGCRVRGWLGNPAQAQCSATDEFGTQAVCVSDDPSHVAAVQAISTYSWIQFWWIQDPNRPVQQCFAIWVSSRSFHIPDTRDQNPGGK